MFHTDQRALTLVTCQWYYTHDVFNNTKICEGNTPQSQLGAYWTHEDTPQFAICSEINGTFVINIYKLQPTSDPPLHILTSFSIPNQSGTFSFSPLSFHASFVTNTEAIILNVQDSKVLLQHKMAQQAFPPPGQFSSDGNFYACKTSTDEICVWQNAPTGYVLWSCLRPRLPLNGFSWSPASSSILSWGSEGIQLLNPGKLPSPLPLKKDKPHHKNGSYLVGYSTDRTHIVTTQQWDSEITVLDLLSDTPQQSINTNMEVWDMKVIDNIIFAVDEHKLVSWDLRAGGIVQSGCSTGGVAIDRPLRIGPHAEHLTLSHDCSQVAFVRDTTLFLYNVESQENICKDIGRQASGIKFSLDGSKLWPTRTTDTYYLKGLEVVWDLSSSEVTKVSPEEMELLFDPSPPHEYHIGIGSRWIEDYRGTKILWLPPNWRIKGLQDRRWDGNFLSLIGGHFPQPIVIKFKP